MKKIVYFIIAFTMLYGVDSEARLPKSQGQMAADLLLTKAKIAEKDKVACKEFIIDTIYTTKGRNNFAQWMKWAYQECTYNNNWLPRYILKDVVVTSSFNNSQTIGKIEGDKYKHWDHKNKQYIDIKEGNSSFHTDYWSVNFNKTTGYYPRSCTSLVQAIRQKKQCYFSTQPHVIDICDHVADYNNEDMAGATIRNEYNDHYTQFCELFTKLEIQFPDQITNIPSEQKPEVIKLANAFFPCWTGTFTAFFISANSKQYVDNTEKRKLFVNKTYIEPTANGVINVSGAPSLWVLSADDNTEQAKRYNAILSKCNNNNIKKILWVMFVLETVDDPEVIKNLISIDKDGNTLPNENITKTYGSPVSIYTDKISIGWPKVTTPDYDVVPVPNTFYLDNKQNPHGTCMLSTILNLYNWAGLYDETFQQYMNNLDQQHGNLALSNEIIPGLTSTEKMRIFANKLQILDQRSIALQPCFRNFIKFLLGLKNQKLDTNQDTIVSYIDTIGYDLKSLANKDECIKNINKYITGETIKQILHNTLKCEMYSFEATNSNAWQHYQMKLKKDKKTITVTFGPSGRGSGDFHIEITNIENE